MLEQLCAEKQQKMSVVIRITPGIEAHTHDYILTGQEDSKFGFGLQNGQAEEALSKIIHSTWLIPSGIHCHIGSQIFETTVILAVQRYSKLYHNGKRHFHSNQRF